MVMGATCLLSCGSEPAAEDQSPTGRLFRRHCAVCHGINGDGGQVGDKSVPSLRNGRALNDSDAALRQQIERGGKGMPPFMYQLDQEQIDDLVRFVRQRVQTVQPMQTSSGAVTR